jgi:hypothetical protein
MLRKGGPSAGQRRIRTDDAVGALDHGALEAARLHRDILGEEPRDGDAGGRISRRVGGEPRRRERLLRQQRAARRGGEQAQIGHGAGQCRVLPRPRLQPLGGALQAVEAFSRTPVQPKAGSLLALIASTVRRSSSR